MQDRYGVLPEGIDYTTLAATSKGNQLRPEFADAAFSLWLVTRDERVPAAGEAALRRS